MKLKDRVIVITGASQGLGESLAYKLASEKAMVVLVARTEKLLKKVKSKIKKENGKAGYFVCDVSNDKLVEEAVNGVIKKFGKIDILVNNAGVWYEGSTIKHSPSKVRELFLTNSVGPIYMARAVLPFMKERKSGQIFNVISSAGVGPSAGWGVYTATKFALRGLTDSLKLELEGTGIKVMGFYPGGMNTKLFDNAGFGRINKPWMMKKEDVVKIIVFMLEQPDDLVMDHVEVNKFFK